ncbi:hypothetical protein RSAG8_10109, partial [Rhizoctonia solani AG-8 WAC10335]
MTNAEHSSFPSVLDSQANTNGFKPVKIDWEAAAARKRDDRANRLKPYAHWSLGNLIPPPSHKNVTSLVHARLTDRERTFLASDVTDLARRLAVKECTAVEVTTAFCKATYAAQELTNCVTEVMFNAALARAQELDAHILDTGKVVGPLHGIPVSIKDHIYVKGEDTATGFVAWAGRTVAEEDAVIVQILRAAGAVIYVKTTNPQSLYALETCSNIYGSTTNPYNRSLTSGGSSGGEGALIGSRASLLGVGTDIGGSIMPIGVVRLVRAETVESQTPRFRHCKAMSRHGKYCRGHRDLELFFRVVSGSEPWNIDFSALCMPWRTYGCSTLAQSWAMNVRRDQFRAKALKHWNETALRSKSGRPVDVVLCPVAPTLAPPHGTTRWIGYTAYWNLLDLPAVVFPFGEPFDASNWDSATESSSGEPRNPIDEFVKAQWKPEAFDGAPIGLQLVGRRWQEEKLLAALKHVEDAVAQFEKS